jgi:hypothetical protein
MFYIVKRNIFQRGIRKRVKIKIPITVVQLWLCLGEQHHSLVPIHCRYSMLQAEIEVGGKTNM